MVDIFARDAVTHGRAENLHTRIVLRNCRVAVQGQPVIDGSALRCGYARQQAPCAQGAATARQILIGGLAQDADIFGIVSELAPLHPRNETCAFPGDRLVSVACRVLVKIGRVLVKIGGNIAVS